MAVHLLHVNSAGQQVGGDQDAGGARTELAHHQVALLPCVASWVERQIRYITMKGHICRLYEIIATCFVWRPNIKVDLHIKEMRLAAALSHITAPDHITAAPWPQRFHACLNNVGCLVNISVSLAPM